MHSGSEVPVVLFYFSLFLTQQISVDSLQQLCYASDVSGNWEIYRLDLDTLVSINLTQNSDLDAYPSWSPDGQQITFFSSRDGNNEIYIMQADGSHSRRLTNHPAKAIEPADANVRLPTAVDRELQVKGSTAVDSNGKVTTTWVVLKHF